MKAAGRQIRSAGGGIKGAAEVLRQEMHTLITALRAADLKPSDWYTPGDLAVILRTACDPRSPPPSTGPETSAATWPLRALSRSGDLGAGCGRTPPPRGAVGLAVATVPGLPGIPTPRSFSPAASVGQ